MLWTPHSAIPVEIVEVLTGTDNSRSISMSSVPRPTTPGKPFQPRQSGFRILPSGQIIPSAPPFGISGLNTFCYCFRPACSSAYA